MTPSTSLLIAQNKAIQLLQKVELSGMIRAGISEKQLSKEIMDLAKQDFDILKYWHKRIVRAGENTLCPYDENPEDRIIQNDDILFVDLGPILDLWEADLGRTYIIGNNPVKIQLKNDVETLWYETAQYVSNNPLLTSAAIYAYVTERALQMGWEFGGEIAGHLIGQFPHVEIEKEKVLNYIHPMNNERLSQQYNWILEIHLVDKKRKIGAFFEQLLLAN